MKKEIWIIFTIIFFTVALIELYFILYPPCPKPEAVAAKSETETPVSGVEVEHRPQITGTVETTIEETTPEGSRVIDPSKTGEFPQWKELKTGMTKAEVRALLGKPKLIKKGITEIWRYSYTSDRFGDVVFYDGKVITWLEPVITLYD